MANQWIIKKDFINDVEPIMGVTSINFDPNIRMPFEFDLYDDDDVLYFSGSMSDGETEEAFYPLDELGASYGCTYIEVNGEIL